MGKIRQIFENLNIKDKLTLLFAVALGYVVFFCFYVVFSYGKLRNDIEQFTSVQSASIYPLFVMADELYGLVVQNHAIIESNADVVTIQRHHNRFNQFYEVGIKAYERTLSTVEEARLLDRFKNEYVLYQNVNKDIIRLLINGQTATAKELLSVKEISAFDDMRKTLGLMYDAHRKILVDGDLRLSNQASRLRFGIIVSSLPLVLIIVFIAIYAYKYLQVNMTRTCDYMRTLSKGIAPEGHLPQGKSEFGNLNKIINDTADRIKKLTVFSNKIAEGDYSTGIDADAPEGSMARSLINLRNKLVASEEEHNKRRIEDEQRNWATLGIAKFGEILRHSNENITTLSDEVIKNLVHYINASQGGLFILDDSDTDHVVLDMLSAFAYDRKKFLSRRIALGDGLIGVCALEKNTIYITDVPDDYMEIESGLGDSKPKCLLIVPLKSEDKILGVIELASFNLMKQYEIQFVEQLGDSIASQLASLRINAQTADLLQESQKKSDELLVREKELRRAMDEMTKATDDAQRRESEMSSILLAVDETMLKAELSPEGKFLSANQKFLSALGYRKDELLGRNIQNIMPEDYAKNFEIVWQNIISGQSYQASVNQKNKFGENLWLLTQYTPIFDAHGAVVRVLYLANDITEQKVAEEKNQKLLSESLDKAKVLMATQEKMAKNEIEMSGILSAVDETMMKAEYTVEGNMISANAKHITAMGYDYEKTKGKNILTFIPDEEIADFKALWQNVCEGNLHQMIVKRVNKFTEKPVWLINQYTPVKDANGKVLKILYTAFDITKHKEAEERALDQMMEMKKQNERYAAQIENYKEKESVLKVQISEMEKIQEMDLNGESSPTQDKYKAWLKSFD